VSTESQWLPLEHWCQDLVGSLDGSGDSRDDLYCRRIIQRLQQRLADWQPSSYPQRKAYDEAARQRVLAAIELAEGLMISRRVHLGGE
jgi:hypothetical protein